VRLTSPGWVDAACSLCKSRDRTERFRDGRFGVYRCASCGLTYVSPRRADERLLAEVYDESYWRSSAPRERGYADYSAEEPLWQRTWERRIETLSPRLPAPGSALDVGCASGLFLEALARGGWQVTGLEPSRAMAERAALRLGSERVLALPIEAAELEPAAYDLICMWDVIEHLADPVAALARIERALRPGGRLVLLTQDVASPLARLLGPRWHHYKHDEHLLHFEPRTLALALERADLSVVFATRRSAGKWVPWSFVVERSARLASFLPALLARLSPRAPRSLYVNLGDEMLVVAGRKSETESR
jgi:SAM-dependent methyltransferase